MSARLAALPTAALGRRRVRRGLPSRLVLYGILMILAALFAAPFLWMISTSLKTGPSSIATPPVWIPDPIVWSNYPDALTKINFPQALRNTLIYAVPSVIGTVASCCLAAYGFARIKWPGRDLVFVVLLATMMLNDQVTFIPLYVIYSKLGWVGTFLPLIVPTFLGSPFFIFLLRQFFLGIPTELSDAARIDGASELRILARIIVPLSWPAIITVALFTFIDKWTDFFKPLVYLHDPALQPLSLAIQTFQSTHKTDWPLSMAASVAITAPLVVLYFFAQRKFIEGITLTGIKG
ncbi:MAG: multiple sugar transport system permease protein [Chloroflexota bacterium]|jgi:multiple sugar transport system permease protein|nr:multiple sugar transport system permease protein [Chloroflexota bacterium]